MNSTCHSGGLLEIQSPDPLIKYEYILVNKMYLISAFVVFAEVSPAQISQLHVI